MEHGLSSSTRREFLAEVGLVAVGSALAPKLSAAESRSDLIADPKRELIPNGSDLGSLWPGVQVLADANRYSASFLSSRFADVAEFQATARAKLLELLLYQPAPVSPGPQLLERVDCGDYFRERIEFSTSPNMRVPAYVLIPKGLTKPTPAIVDLHSHGGMFLFGKEKVMDLGRNHPAMTTYHHDNYEGRPTATNWVRHGYVVITIDAFMFGERRTVLDAGLPEGWDRSRYSLELVKRLNQHCREKETTLVKALTFAGATWPGMVFWDDLRTVDYLVTRPEVDPKRIGCVGVSMGGYRSLFLSALDPRIRAACVVGFMSTVRSMIHAHLDTHSWVHFLPALHRYLDWPDVASLAAPRSLMVLQCSRDELFPASGMKDAIAQIGTLFEKMGAKDRFSGRFYDVPHQFNRQMQDDALAWFDRELS